MTGLAKHNAAIFVESEFSSSHYGCCGRIFQFCKREEESALKKKKSRADKDRRRWGDSAGQCLLFRSGVLVLYGVLNATARDTERYEILLDYREGSVTIAAYHCVITFGSSCLTESLPVSAPRLIVTIRNLKLT